MNKSLNIAKNCVLYINKKCPLLEKKSEFLKILFIHVGYNIEKKKRLLF